MADRQTKELDPVKESPISGLPEILELYDETMIPVQQEDTAMHMTGKQFREFGEKTAEIYVQTAVDAAESASQSANEAAESADEAAKSEQSAKEYSGKPPVPNPDTGHWDTWDAGQKAYTDTGEPYQGNLLYATFYLDPADGVLYMVTDRDYHGPEFRLNNGVLEVALNE